MEWVCHGMIPVCYKTNDWRLFFVFSLEIRLALAPSIQADFGQCLVIIF